jgi:tetratricopeptide (TPR) repeat protein
LPVDEQQFALASAGRTARRRGRLRLGCLLGLAMAALLPAAFVDAEAPALPNAVEAGQRERRLEALFHRLTSTDDAIEGDTIVDEIWRVWLQSGRAEIDELMQNALALLEAGKPLAAMASLDQIVQQAPDWAEGWNKRATVLYLLDEYDRSLADIDRVLALEPRHFGALAGRGLIHIAREDYRAALDDYRRARAANPFLKGAAEIIPSLERKAGERPL